MDQDELAGELSDMVYHASGGSDLSYLYAEFREVYSLEDVKDILLSEGFRWNALVQEEVELILSDMPRKYFLSEHEWVNLYRANRNIEIAPIPDEERFMHGSDTIEYMERVWKQQREEIAKYGVTLDSFEMGYACFQEQGYFYKTQEWLDRAKAARYVAGNACEHCKRRNSVLHVHHNTPIISAYHYNFDLNFAEWKLETLCKECHEKYHQRTIRAGYGHIFVDSERVTEEKQELAKLQKAHDEIGSCQFCKNDIAKRYPN